MASSTGEQATKPGPEDRAAFEALYETYRNQLFKFACYLAENRREAEDLFQETWLRVAQHFHNVPDMKSAKPWIMTIAVNLHRDILRKKRIRTLLFARRTDASEFLQETADSPWGSKPAGAEERTEREETALAIDKALTVLPAGQRRVFVLKEIEGFKHSEISEMLGLPVGTIKSLLYRAVRRLQRELKAYGLGASKQLEMEKCGVKTSNV